MTIITAGDKKFKQFIGVSQAQVKKFGYPILIYDLGELGEGIPFKASFEKVDGLIKNLWKPSLILDAYKRVNDFLVWLDGDAILWNSIDEVVEDYDIGVTLRRQDAIAKSKTPELTGQLNSGVIFINHTEKALEFLNEWNELCQKKEAKTDQQVLSSMVGEVTGWAKYNVILERKGVKIKIFKTDKYNCYYFQERLNNKDNRILHFKGGNRGRFFQFI